MGKKSKIRKRHLNSLMSVTRIVILNELIEKITTSGYTEWSSSVEEDKVTITFEKVKNGE